MNKKQALKVLLNHNFFLPEEVKQKILAKTDTISEKDVYNLGRSLAVIQKNSLENNQKLQKQIDLILARIDSSDEKG